MKLITNKHSEIKTFELLLNSIYILRDNRGIALVMVLILSLISLVFMSGLIYMVTSGTQVSGIEKRYKTALEAGKSGRDIVYQVLSSRGETTSLKTDLESNSIPFAITAPGNCLTQKLNTATGDWDTSCSSSLNMVTYPTPDPSTYDMIFTLGSGPAYSVYSKIVDTVLGNSGNDEELIKTGVVITNPGDVTVMNIPYLYTIEIDAKNINNPIEQAKYSILYQY
ncbi:MAG: hypothetical protein C4538_01355 [Nitrospiraceae bacterium]|nr:MAG: hypothetical protein C4538_01355 [Nitrospiraceae bacterium]